MGGKGGRKCRKEGKGGGGEKRMGEGGRRGKEMEGEVKDRRKQL